LAYRSPLPEANTEPTTPMPLPTHFTQPAIFEDRPVVVELVARANAMWDRPIFRAPPLKVILPRVSPEIFKSLPTPVSTLSSR
jgi:hypothetical protein